MDTTRAETQFDFDAWRREYAARQQWMRAYIFEALEHGGTCTEVLWSYQYSDDRKDKRPAPIVWTSTTVDHPNSTIPEGPRAHGRSIEALADHLQNRHFGFGWDLDVSPAGQETERYRAGKLLDVAYVVDTHVGAMSQILVCPACYARDWASSPTEDIGLLTAPSLERLRVLENEPIDPGPRLAPAPAIMKCETCGVTL